MEKLLIHISKDVIYIRIGMTNRVCVAFSQVVVSGCGVLLWKGGLVSGEEGCVGR